VPLSRSRDYLSIGEVLETIKEDFPDISISKIRFLESEGLISPERTGSGYRKFFDQDLARLRYILALQRDEFLPLRVIRQRLEEVEANGGVPPQPGAAGDGKPSSSRRRPRPSESPAPLPSDVQMNRKELSEASGLGERELAGLQDFGLLARDGTFDGNDLVVARAARRLFDYGIEPRHLRVYRQWAEREAALIEQIVGPVTKRRSPQAQQDVTQSASELLDLSRQLREALLRSSLRPLL
jgi:DNA-binding transcriptional MerR regulator